MKFMKLGSKPDIFQADGRFIKFVNYALEADIIIKVDEVKFYLHKFPLMSKSNRLLRLVVEAQEEGSNEIDLVDFPGGPKALEICAKFCYGMTVTLNAYNVVAARCAAEYLEMTEDVEHGNLVFKVEVFLSSCILRSWKDSIIVLQTTKLLLPESKTLKIVGRCVDSVASKASLDVENVYWSYTYSRKSSLLEKENVNVVPVDWWVEDTCELEIDLFKRVMAAIKCKGRIDGGIISEALETYVVRWLTECAGPYISDAHKKSNKSLVETIICLLPAENRGGCVRCAFLVKLLKVGISVGLNESSQRYLAKQIGSQLHKASIEDLLIRARPTENTTYDYGVVKSFVHEFIANEICTPGHESLLTVGRLIDRFLAEMAHDPNVEVSSFVVLAASLPEAARPVHDGLYKAIDLYLREHPSIAKPERKQLCQLMDVKKLTGNALMHAARNEQLPLRVVVQVLFFEQLRTGARVQACRSNSCDGPSTVENTGTEKAAAGDHRKLIKMGSTNSARRARLLPSRSWRMLDKFNFYHSYKGNTASRSSETSGSSQSPACLVPKDAYVSSVLRQRRYSVS